jgi:hypothetical protein
VFELPAFAGYFWSLSSDFALGTGFRFNNPNDGDGIVKIQASLYLQELGKVVRFWGSIDARLIVV